MALQEIIEEIPRRDFWRRLAPKIRSSLGRHTLYIPNSVSPWRKRRARSSRRDERLDLFLSLGSEEGGGGPLDRIGDAVEFRSRGAGSKAHEGSESSRNRRFSNL